jgi:hypothetical protein
MTLSRRFGEGFDIAGLTWSFRIVARRMFSGNPREPKIDSSACFKTRQPATAAVAEAVDRCAF